MSLTKIDRINTVMGGGGHVVILGAGASIASTFRNPELTNKKLPSMDNFIDIIGLSDIIKKIPKHLLAKNFEELYSNLHNENPTSDEISEIQSRVYNYFEDMRLPDVPTIYDYLVLSLRSKDLYEPTKLLFPIGQKNYYEDEFIKNEWDNLKYWLNSDSTKRVTIFGYGAPKSDTEAVRILNDAWGTKGKRNMEQFEIIDIRKEDIIRETWDDFIHSHHYDYSTDYFQSSLAYNPHRTIESYFQHCSPRTPSEAFSEDNPIPKDFKTLNELWDWHKPLIEVENIWKRKKP